MACNRILYSKEAGWTAITHLNTDEPANIILSQRSQTHIKLHEVGFCTQKAQKMAKLNPVVQEYLCR